MPTTGGALAFDALVPPYEATLAKNLRAAGAIILAKTQLTELANWVADAMPANYNALNGYGMRTIRAATRVRAPSTAGPSSAPVDRAQASARR
jgi:amidase